jgi:hypothetical protein
MPLATGKSFVSFICKTCGQEGYVPYPLDGEAAGFVRSMKWLSPERGPDPANPLLLERSPKDGEKHSLLVRFPFSAASGEPFWCLYQPPLSYNDGWEEQPQAIPESSVVECRLLQITDDNAESAKVQVEILRSVPVPEIAGAFASIERGGSSFAMFGSRRAAVSRFDRYWHLSYSFEGDAGSWAIIERRGGEDRLLMHGDWGWHMDWFSVENRRLSESESGMVARLADEQDEQLQPRA